MSCKKCQDGIVYTCNNCGSQADYDYEFQATFCNTCEMLKEDYDVYSYECSFCNKSNEDNNIILNSSIKDLKESTDEVIKKYKINNNELRLFIDKLIRCSPNIHNVTSFKRTFSFRNWSNENYKKGLEEIKGTNLLIINLCNEYLRELQSINITTEEIYSKLKTALNKLEGDVSNMIFIDEHKKGIFEIDRSNILQALKELEELKNDISSNLEYNQLKEEEIKKRERMELEYENYTIDIIQKEQDRAINLLLNVDI